MIFRQMLRWAKAETIKRKLPEERSRCMCQMQTLGCNRTNLSSPTISPGITGTSTYVPYECRLLLKSIYLSIPLGQGRPSRLRDVPTAPSRMGHHGALDHYSYAIQQYLLAGITNVFEKQIVVHPIDYLSESPWLATATRTIHPDSQ